MCCARLRSVSYKIVNNYTHLNWPKQSFYRLRCALDRGADPAGCPEGGDGCSVVPDINGKVGALLDGLLLVAALGGKAGRGQDLAVAE